MSGLNTQQNAFEYALFDVKQSGLAMANDLFEDKQMITDVEGFWKLQREALDQEIEKHKGNGWEVLVFESDQNFWKHNFEEAPKANGGQAMININESGQINFNPF